MQSIAILEDNISLRETLKDFIQLSGKYTLAFASGNYKDFIDNSDQPEPDFILLDVHLPDTMGVDIIAAIKSIFRKSVIIIITGDYDQTLLLKAMENGASSYILKPFTAATLQKTIEQVNITGSFLEPALLTQLLQQINIRKKQSVPTFDERLTDREDAVLDLIKKGLTYREIALQLHISYHTVNHHLKNIYTKTNVTSKAELIAKYYMNN